MIAAYPLARIRNHDVTKMPTGSLLSPAIRAAALTTYGVAVDDVALSVWAGEQSSHG
jgi:hypothetical protein